MGIIILIVVYIGIFYYLFVGRRKKAQKKQDELMSKLAPGTGIVTISGICCRVVEVHDNDLVVDLSADFEKPIKAKLHRGAVKQVK